MLSMLNLRGGVGDGFGEIVPRRVDRERVHLTLLDNTGVAVYYRLMGWDAAEDRSELDDESSDVGCCWVRCKTCEAEKERRNFLESDVHRS